MGAEQSSQELVYDPNPPPGPHDPTIIDFRMPDDVDVPDWLKKRLPKPNPNPDDHILWRGMPQGKVGQ